MKVVRVRSSWLPPLAWFNLLGYTRTMPYKDIVKQKQAQHESYVRKKTEVADRFKVRRQEMVRWFRDLKSAIGCSVCPEKDSWCIDLHHVHDKEGGLTPMIYSLRAESRIRAELSKCIPLCSNCHRKLHRGTLEVEPKLNPDWYKVDGVTLPSFWKL